MTNFFNHKMRGRSPGEIIGIVLFGGIAIIGLAILFGFIIMWLWNWLMPDIFGLPELDYWRAVGLFILLKILIGGCGGSGRSHKHSKRDRCKDRRHTKRNDFSKWKYYDQFWEEEGRKQFELYRERKEQNNPLDPDTNI